MKKYVGIFPPPSAVEVLLLDFGGTRESLGPKPLVSHMGSRTRGQGAAQNCNDWGQEWVMGGLQAVISLIVFIEQVSMGVDYIPETFWALRT